MIALTKLNGSEFVVNAELIKFIESTPDTIITLRDGEKLMVKEVPEQIVKKVIEYARTVRSIPEIL